MGEKRWRELETESVREWGWAVGNEGESETEQSAERDGQEKLQGGRGEGG